MDYFRILKALIFFFSMSNVPIQNKKVLEETLAGFNSDVGKTTLNGLEYFEMTLPLLKVPEKPVPIPLSLCHI